MNISRYSGKIVCKKCNKNFKTKKERNKIKYLCSGYDRFGKEFCEREIIAETFLDDLISFHYKKELTNDEVEALIKVIEVHKDKWIIKYNDDSETIISKSFYKI